MAKRLFDLFRRAAALQHASLGRANPRPFNSVDAAYCRTMKGLPLPDQGNPGIRVSPGFVDDDEATALVECATLLKASHGFVASGEQQVLALVGAMQSDLGLSVVAERVTGRPELPQQNVAPWLYGDKFNLKGVPLPLLQLAEKVAQDASFGLPSGLSSLRDITINYRDNSLFKLDPHCDPPSDGDNIFILGLLSDVVLTFTPPTDGSSPLPVGCKMRTQAGAISVHSWTDADIDVLLRQQSLVHFTGAARQPWRHAIRTGLDVGPPYDSICDWHGNLETLVKRQQRRISIVLAFR